MKGLFGKRVIMGGVSLANRGKVGGFWAKSPYLSSLRAGNRGGGGVSPAKPERRPWGSGAALE